MRKTLTSVTALMLAFGAPAALLAQEQAPGIPQEHQERLEAAGFENVRILSGVEVARVTDDEGNQFFVIGGLDRGAGMGGIGADPMQQGALGEPATGLPDDAAAADADPLAPGAGEAATAETDVPGAEAPAPGAAETAAAEPADPAAPGATPGTGDPAEPPIADVGPAVEPIPPDAPAGDALAADPAAPADPLAGQNLTEGVQAGADFVADLEAQLAELGFDDYEIMQDAHVAEVAGANGQVIHVILGVETGGEES